MAEVPRRFSSVTALQARVPALEIANGAVERYGMYRENEVAWQGVSKEILETDVKASLDLHCLKILVRTLAGAELTLASFWDKLTDMVAPLLKSASLDDLLELTTLYAKLRCWHVAVFSQTLHVVRKEAAVHTMEHGPLTHMLATFSEAGRANEELNNSTAALYNEIQDRLLEDAHEMEVDDLLRLLESMARFRAKAATLQHLGRIMHPHLVDAPGDRVRRVCQAYGELGWRHDTIFKNVTAEILNERAEAQRARALGREIHGVKYSTADIAFIAQALLTLKMHRGNTSWCRWEQNYQELVDILVKGVEDGVNDLSAQALASAALVLGRARRGDMELCTSMFDRMIEILKGETNVVLGVDPPQYELARFLYGLSLMPPQEKKLDAHWLMGWLCNQVHTLVLSDLVLINRQLVRLQAYDTEYLKIMAEEFLVERVPQLSKTDIMEVSQTYNQAGLKDEDLGRHFFWALGKRFQSLQARDRMRRRVSYKRVG